MYVMGDFRETELHVLSSRTISVNITENNLHLNKFASIMLDKLIKAFNSSKRQRNITMLQHSKHTCKIMKLTCIDLVS